MTEKIKLISLDGSFMPAINAGRNDQELVSKLGTSFRFLPQETAQAWYEGYLSDLSKQERAAIVRDDKQSEILGMVSLTNIDWLKRSCEFHIHLFKDRGLGIGTEATRLMVEHAFSDLGLHRVFLTVHEDNVPAIKVYNKVGFRQEGVLRDAVFKNGRFKNSVIMSILSTDPRLATCQYPKSL